MSDPIITHWIIFSLFVISALLVSASSAINSEELNLTQGNTCTQNGNGTQGEEGDMKLTPLIDDKKVKMMMVMNETRRKLGSFQICAPCTCCGGAKGYCLPSPCCYAISCNIPNKPFGFCSFTPRSCNCFRCHL